MSRARTIANFGVVSSSATELNLLDGETDLATQTELNDKLAISTATSTYAQLASPIFTGTPETPILKLTPTATASAPTGVAGAIYYDSDENALMQYGTSWKKVSSAIATGGTVTTSGIYTIHTFTGDGTLTVSGGVLLVDVIIIAGGGCGGYRHAGGGGGGGLIYMQNILILSGVYGAVIGAGGTCGVGPSESETNGSDTTFLSETSIGGGRGGSYQWNYGGATGGSAGGASGGGSASPQAGSSGAQPNPTSHTGTGYANDSGDGSHIGSPYWNHIGGGGGGAGTAGQDFHYSGDVGVGMGYAGNGGDGIQIDIDGNNYYWAGGGGGSTYSNSTTGNGGLGGGGGGSANSMVAGGTGGGTAINTGGNGAGSNAKGGNGGTNTGGGGGGGAQGRPWDSNAQGGGNGGSGIVIVRYLT